MEVRCRVGYSGVEEGRCTLQLAVVKVKQVLLACLRFKVISDRYHHKVMCYVSQV